MIFVCYALNQRRQTQALYWCAASLSIISSLVFSSTHHYKGAQAPERQAVAKMSKLIFLWTDELSLEQKREELTSKRDALLWHTDEKEQKGQCSSDAIIPQTPVKGNSLCLKKKKNTIRNDTSKVGGKKKAEI